jgi:hypothetical protein
MSSFHVTGHRHSAKTNCKWHETTTAQAATATDSLCRQTNAEKFFPARKKDKQAADTKQSVS